MKKPTCHYTFLARTALKNPITGKIEFKAIEKKFENENPIEARKEVFRFTNQFIYGMLISIGLSEEEIGWCFEDKSINNLTEREIRKLINPYLEPEDNSTYTSIRTDDTDNLEIAWEAPNDTLSWYPKFNNGIWVVFWHDDVELIQNEFNEGQEVKVIYKVSRYEEPLPTPPNYFNLIEEYNFYKKYDFDIKDFKITTLFFDDEEYFEGKNDFEDGGEDFIKEITHLKTPFDWSGYDKIHWWLKDEDKIEYNTPPFLDNTGVEENQNCEYKPGLINWKNSKRDIEFEIAKTICAFLNAKGGYLFIGFSDSGEIIGLDFSKITKDFFLREFTRIKSMHLPASIAHTIYGKFYPVNEKEVFVVTVYPSIHEPVFLRRKDENNRFIKEFYVRSDASSRHIYDIEEVVKYCKLRWYS